MSTSPIGRVFPAVAGSALVKVGIPTGDNFSMFDGSVPVASLLSLPYKVYTALLTQSGGNAPVATVLQNTIGDIVWGYVGDGSFTATLAGAFAVNKTFTLLNMFGDDNGTPYFSYARNGSNTDELSLYVFKSDLSQPSIIGDAGTNVGCPIEIRVYN